MGRSVSYLSNAVRVNYFPWPMCKLQDEDGNDTDIEQYEDEDLVVENIQDYFISKDSSLMRTSRWDGRESRIILEGNGVEIGLSEYCGLASLSVRVEESDYMDEDDNKKAMSWIEKNWENISKPWSQYKKVGTFSNGEGVYEEV